MARKSMAHSAQTVVWGIIFCALGTLLDVSGHHFGVWRGTLRHQGVSKSSLGQPRRHLRRLGGHFERPWGAIGVYFGATGVPFDALGSPKASIWRSFRGLEETMKTVILLK